jgi:hypothetical protein
MQSVTTWKKDSEPKIQRSRIHKHMKINIWRILHTWRWPCRPKHVVKDSENQHNKAARRRKYNLQYPLRRDSLPVSLLLSHSLLHAKGLDAVCLWPYILRVHHHVAVMPQCPCMPSRHTHHRVCIFTSFHYWRSWHNSDGI